MNFAQKARAATVGALVVLLLAGCASGPSDAASAPLDNGATKTTAPAAQTQPEWRKVTALKVIDPVTVVVTPLAKTDSLYGKDFTVHVNDISAPAKGECGYDEALALAKKTLTDHVWLLQYGTVKDGVYIDGHGDHHGYLYSNHIPYGLVMVGDGMAYAVNLKMNSDAQNEAKAAGTGLWTSCPGFGA